MSDNYANILFPLGIACYACVDSVFTNNVMVTAPGARYRTRMAIVGGSNNIISGNVLGAYPPVVKAITLAAGSAAAVPEPMIWAQLIAGFGVVGVIARRRTGAVGVRATA
ncbi:MAG: PEPxxWA-CTERM sorting domain-containing protein [Sandarakinorhabdus sp.]|nr:PEPxxWA-CTERM sorting domain-containing protein [Sandarakinorhabdus sp.]